MKNCSKCKQEKDLSQFGIRSNHNGVYYDSWCKECYRKNAMKSKKKVLTKCIQCNEESFRYQYSLKLWSGLCRSCSNKEVANRPEIKNQKSIQAKEQVNKQGGIPNAVKFKSVDKERHPHWKGGLPKCIDCNKELSLYTCKRCVACTTKKRSGDGHWNWKGGLSDENTKVRQSKEYKEWRLNVFKRDYFSCQCCGYRSKGGSDIRADHIKPFHLFPELRLDLSNGRTLCVKCDGIYGYNYFRDKDKRNFLV